MHTENPIQYGVAASKFKCLPIKIERQEMEQEKAEGEKGRASERGRWAEMEKTREVGTQNGRQVDGQVGKKSDQEIKKSEKQAGKMARRQIGV